MAVEMQSVDCAAETMILATAENSIMLPDSFEGIGLYRFTILKDTHKSKVDELPQKEIRKSEESAENGDLKRSSI